MSLCKYANILGKPKEGAHRFRFMDIAIVDVLLTFTVAFIIYIIGSKIFNSNISYLTYLIALFILGIFLHRLFCVRTTIDKLLFK